MVEKINDKRISLLLLLIAGSILHGAGTTTSTIDLKLMYFQSRDNNDNFASFIKQDPTLASSNLESQKSAQSAASSQIESTPQIAVLLFKFNNFASDDLSAQAAKINLFLDELDQYWYQASYGTVDIAFDVRDPSNNDGWYVLPEVRDQYTMITAYEDILDAADATDTDFSTLCPYDYVLIWLNDKFCSASCDPDDVKDGFFTQGPYATVNIGDVSKPVAILGYSVEDLFCPDSVAWGKAAHIMGHLFGFDHTYSTTTPTSGTHIVNSIEDSYYSLMGRYLRLTSSDVNYPVDLSIFSRTRQPMTQNWLSSSNLREIQPGDAEQIIDVMPRSLTITAVQFLNISHDSTGLSYYGVEVINNSLNDNDQLAPRTGVLIYNVSIAYRLTDMNVTTDQPVVVAKVDILYDTDDVFVDNGGNTDPDDDITIEIMQLLSLGYKIKVRNQVVSTPLAPPDLKIEPWGYPPYESVDIWIDSPGNGWGFYQTDNPDGNRDIPAWFDRNDPNYINEPANKIYANITNLGEEKATDVVVRFWDRMLTAGEGYDFHLLGEKEIGTLSGYDIPVAVFVDWRPTIGIVADTESGIGQTPGGACLFVNVTASNEPADKLMNNGLTPDDWSDPALRAQENVHQLIDLTIGSQSQVASYADLRLFQNGEEPLFNLSDPNTPRVISFDIGNPFSIEKHIYVNFIDRNNNWILDNATATEGINEFHTIPAFGKLPMTLQLFPNLNGAQVGDLLEAEIMVSHIQIIGGEIGLIPFGGFDIQGRVVYQTSLTISASGDSDTITVTGSLSTPDPNVDIDTILPGSHNGTRAIRIDFRDKQTKGLINWGIAFLDNTSKFRFEYSDPKDGTYLINAVYIGSEKLGPSVSSVEEVEVESASWDLIAEFGALLIIALTIIIALAIIIFLLHRSKEQKSRLGR